MRAESVLHGIEVGGIVTFALSGIFEARRKEMDVVGICAVALATAFGGGTMRDLLLGRLPVFWVTNEFYTVLVLLTAVAGALILQRLPLTPRAVLIPDALGLGLFSIMGADFSLQTHPSSYVIAALMGATTGVVGGVIRDVLCNEIPMVFRRMELYTICSLFGMGTYFVLQHLRIDQSAALILGIMVTFVTRILSIQFNWRLPV